MLRTIPPHATLPLHRPPRTRPETALPAAAGAAIPADDGPAPSTQPDRDPDRVHRLKPWQPRSKYRMSRNANVSTELNARSGAVAMVVEDQWWPIDCRLVGVTQNGAILWNRIPGVGWVAEHESFLPNLLGHQAIANRLRSVAPRYSG